MIYTNYKKYAQSTVTWVLTNYKINIQEYFQLERKHRVYFQNPQKKRVGIKENQS